jgi:hypothetical protein
LSPQETAAQIQSRPTIDLGFDEGIGEGGQSPSPGAVYRRTVSRLPALVSLSSSPPSRRRSSAITEDSSISLPSNRRSSAASDEQSCSATSAPTSAQPRGSLSTQTTTPQGFSPRSGRYMSRSASTTPPYSGSSRRQSDVSKSLYVAARAAQVSRASSTSPTPRRTSAKHLQLPSKRAFVGERALHALFKRYDEDASGDIDEIELTQLLSDIGTEARLRDVRAILAKLDCDRDGRVGFEDFSTWYVQRKAADFEAERRRKAWVRYWPSRRTLRVGAWLTMLCLDALFLVLVVVYGRLFGNAKMGRLASSWGIALGQTFGIGARREGFCRKIPA